MSSWNCCKKDPKKAIKGFRLGGYEGIASQIHQIIENDEGEAINLTCNSYRQSGFQKLAYYFVCIIFFGIPLLFFRWYPPLEVYIFWKKCFLDDAEIVLIKESGMKAAKRKISTVQFENEEEPLRFFSYKLQKFVWCNLSRQFKLLRGLADGVNTLSGLCSAPDGISHQERNRRLKIYDSNVVHIKVEPFWKIWMKNALYPFIVFEALSVILWIFDEYSFYAFFVIVYSLVTVTVSTRQERMKKLRLHNMVSASKLMSKIIVRHKNEEYECDVDDLVPGDVIKIPPRGFQMPCDAILLAGSCIVTESDLTGESAPVLKTSPVVSPDSRETYSPSSVHMRHTLFCGTQIIQTRYYGDDEVLAIVTQTGRITAKGQLIQAILFPKELVFDFFDEAMKCVIALFCLAGIAMIYSTYVFILRGSSLETLLLRTLDLVTITVPPTLPGAMLAVSMHSLSRLKKSKIFCSSHPRIVVAGKTKLVCFDKTGTLTEEGLDVWGVLPCNGVQNLSEEEVVKDVTTLEKTSKLLAALATCHSLTIIDKQICGDPLDTSMFGATKWELEEAGEDTQKFDLLSPTVVRPKRSEIPFEIGIIKKFAFTSTTQNMTVICRVLGAPNMIAFSKGAPEKVMGFCKPESLPSNIMEILEHYTSSGFRVIALAHKELPRKFSWRQAQRTRREEIETDMNLLGILLMQNFLKKESGQVIKELNSAHMKCIMATGDNILTAVSVSQECGILPKSCTVATLQFDENQEIVLESLRSSQMKRRQFDLGNDSLYLAIDGNNWSLLRTHFPHLVDIILLKCVVFARMSPLHKTQLITAYQSLGYIVTMCGDGANDCGALKAAHVGISLTNAEASIAAPFTGPDITGVVKIIKEGRCALVTSFILFKFMAMYSMIQFFSVMILYSRGAEMGTNQFLYIDLPVTWSLVVAMGRLEPAENLSPKSPNSKILSAANIIPLLLQIFATYFIQWLSLISLKTQEWYTPVTPAVADEELVLSWENTVVYGVSCYQYVILAFVYCLNEDHQKSMRRNWILLLSFFIMLVINTSLLVIPCDYLATLFQMQPWSQEDAFFRVELLAIPLLHLLITLFIESKITDWIENSYIVRRKNMDRYHYIENKLKSGTPWQFIEV
ncbi:hypothetical protein LSTR_LSTR007010 [Laodelphax striatellus]|uniref:Cation-transporting ATPase n=1 Tax=Laodelphax striatellus TaxID=195883 RepID=A0A482WK53_LAOST|nr:hypothetical protein LSTR_LSTR007010 [Laodelphax striatellus]